jgi:ring-1,2-phenylacetyl-CoA epoxidase subunit PaaA
MLGPTDAESIHTEQSMKWKLKRKSNDDLRQQFIDQTVPQAELIGLTIPDADLKWNEERGSYDFGAINWDEFWQVVKGHGPMNKARMKARVGAWESGEWVRNAAMAHAEKKSRKKTKTSSLKGYIMSTKNWPLWEVFVRSKNGLEHRHCGSLHAADEDMALENARDVYTRRSEGVSIWVVESKHITASNPENNGELFEPAHDKVYRHPTFYELPDDIKHM